MNVTAYLFGNFNNGYTQYPDDYTETIFHNFYINAKSTTQIAIHREGNLIYYGYVRRLEEERYIGFCVVINGLILTKLDGLFSLYENIISNLVTNGQLIHFNEQGTIVTYVDRLYMNHEELDLLSESFRAGFNRFEDTVLSLPAVSYGVSKDSVANFSIEDNLDEIIKSSHTNGYTFIYKSKDFNTTQLNSYKEVLSGLNKAKTELANQYDDLAMEYEKTIKQKKQYRFVAILFLLVLGCGIGLLSLNKNLNNANSIISEQKDSLSKKNKNIANLIKQKQELNEKYSNEQTLRVEAENSFSSLKSIIEGRQSFIIKSTSFNFYTGYLSLYYYGFKNETLKMQIRACNDEGYLCNNSADVNVHLGVDSISIYLNKNLDSRKWYSFEILAGNTIIGGDRH